MDLQAFCSCSCTESTGRALRAGRWCLGSRAFDFDFDDVRSTAMFAGVGTEARGSRKGNSGGKLGCGGSGQGAVASTARAPLLLWTLRKQDQKQMRRTSNAMQ